jgi:trehalose 6-phosphate synthase/phosphatase
MRRLRQRVVAHDVHGWVRRFTDALADATRDPQRTSSPEGVAALETQLAGLARDDRLAVLILDYDGTLVPTARTPSAAPPDSDLRALLRALAARPRTRVHVVSGRPREDLEAWLGDLPIGLHAEHGFWSRPPSGSPWLARRTLDDGWKRHVRPLLDELTASTPGSFVEEKTSALVWHYRLADPEFAARQSRDLRLHLVNALSNAPVEVLSGDKVVEVRAQGIHKDVVLHALAIPDGASIVAMGNDSTDDDLFRALPDTALTVHVGRGATHARYRIWSVDQARALLRRLLTSGAPASRDAHQYA